MLPPIIKSYKIELFHHFVNWSPNRISSCISKRIGLIRKIKFFLPISTLNKLANALVMPHFDYCSSVWSNCNVQYVNSLQILQNRLARVLVSADIRTQIIDLMNTLNWSKLDQRWKLHILLTTFKCFVWRGTLLFIYCLNFPLQLILIIPGVKLLTLWLFHLGKIILGKEHFITGQASYGTIYQMIYVIIINQWACFLLKKFWMLYNKLYCVSYVYFIYLNFIAFPKG